MLTATALAVAVPAPDNYNDDFMSLAIPRNLISAEAKRVY